MEKLKSQKGIGGTDAIIAVVLIALFAGLIATLGYNIYVANSSLKRMSTATGYITDIFEYVDKTYYDDVTEQNIAEEINQKAQEENKDEYKNVKAIQSSDITEETENLKEASYKITIKVEKYKLSAETEEPNKTLDLVKIVTVTVAYKLQGKDQTIEMSKVKKRENLITPNKPDLSLITKNNDSNKIYPIKYINNEWQVTDENDATWYSYTNGIWAVVLETDIEHKVGDKIENINDEIIHIWVPRYACKNDQEVKFLYNTTNKYVEQNENNLNKLSSEEIDSINGDSSTGKWIKREAVSTEKLNSIYQMKNI